MESYCVQCTRHPPSIRTVEAAVDENLLETFTLLDPSDEPKLLSPGLQS